MLVGLLPIFSLGLVGNAQVGNAYLVWARASADMAVFGHAVPVTWLLTFQAIMTVLSLTGSVAFWRFWARRRREPRELTKIVIGLGLMCAAPAALAIGAAQADVAGTRVAAGWLLAFAAFNEIGFANVLPVALALYARAAPPAFGSTIIGIYYLQLVGASILSGWLGGLLGAMDAAHFWLLHAGMIAPAPPWS